jgi:hypothetical protein
MSMSNTSENNLLLLLFNNTNWANLGDATGLRGASTAGSFFIALHTADPGEAGSQTTSEISYTGYARVAVARSGAGFTVASSSVSNAALVTFGPCTAGSGTATYFSIGRDTSGAGEIILSGALSASLAISAGITPQFAIGQLTATAD